MSVPLLFRALTQSQSRIIAGALSWIISAAVFAGPNAYRIAGKATSADDLLKENQGTFYEMEKKKYDTIEQIAKDKYLEYFWGKEGQRAKLSPQVAEKQYLDRNVKVSDAEFKETFDRFKDHPQLKSLDKKEQESQIRTYLSERKKQEVFDKILGDAMAKGELVIDYPKPVEPIFDVRVTDKDHVRYGPESKDTKAMGCDGDKCLITVVEYSEFECPYCSRVVPDIKRLLAEYKGKVRWIVRDYPLPFHARAKPAAIAAKCAAAQGKYWEMYNVLFDNQRALGDADLKAHAVKAGVDAKKFNDCFANPPGEITSLIDLNQKSGSQFGVTGTPAFFINGRRLSGALPYGEFKKIFDEELRTKKG